MAKQLDFTWDWGLIVLSYVNACMGAWIGVKLLSDARRHIQNIKVYFALILLASFGLGLCGIWTMHYSGMVAHKSKHVIITYDVGLVVISGFAAVILVFVGLSHVGRNVDIGKEYKAVDTNKSMWNIRIRKPSKNDLIHCLIGSMIIALGVCTMHYVGMAAVIIDATHEWVIGVIILSVFIAIIVSFVGLLLLLFIDGIYGQLVSCLIIGLAVCVMHYTAMYAVRYYENDNTEWIMNMEEMDLHGFEFTAQLISIVSGCIVTMILISYHIVKFHSYKDSIFYHKRYGSIIINTNVFGLLYIIFGSFSIFIEANTIGYLINEFFALFAFYGLLASLLLRYILAWYSINLLAAKETLTWQTLLNSKLKDIAAESFFFKNIMRYGHIKWLSLRIYLSFICVLLVNFVIFAVTFQNGSMRKTLLPLIVLLIILLLITYFFRHTPASFNDELYIFGEMKLNALVLLFMFLATICGYFIFTDTFGLYYTFLSMICVTIIAIIPIEILLYKQQKSQKNAKQPKQTLSECLSNMETFEKFIKHLNKECAMEVLLFVVEQVQWRNYWGKMLAVFSDADHTPEPDASVTISPPSHTKDVTPILSYLRQPSVAELHRYDTEVNFKLPKDVPMSVIVNGYENELVSNQTLTDLEKIRYCKESAYRLYEKYIFPCAEFEVNISYMCRNELKFVLDDYNQWINDNNMPINELVTVFDATCLELYRLLDQPYSRFLQS